jgi:AcrR family transcriptional regulator
LLHGRTPREGLPLRPAILQAVLQIVSAEGWHALTIRKIAERIRYSPPMIYAVFENKEAICTELVADGFQLLYRHLSAGAAGLIDPSKRLRALLRAYRTFAWEHPAYYQAMYGLGAPAAPGPAVRQGEYGAACLGLVGDALLQAGADARRCPLSPLKAARALLAAAHGVIALHLAGHVADQQEADALYEAVLDGLLAGWGL